MAKTNFNSKNSLYKDDLKNGKTNYYYLMRQQVRNVNRNNQRKG